MITISAASDAIALRRIALRLRCILLPFTLAGQLSLSLPHYDAPLRHLTPASCHFAIAITPLR